jgi:hypothetical protein
MTGRMLDRCRKWRYELQSYLIEPLGSRTTHPYHSASCGTPHGLAQIHLENLPRNENRARPNAGAYLR